MRLTAAAVRIAVLGMAAALLCSDAASGAQDPPEPGQTVTGTYQFHGSAYPFTRYVPTSVTPGRRVPLVVMIHGAQTTATQEIHATGYDAVAEREGFIVLYPDNDPVGSNAPGPINHAWKFYDPTTYFRDDGDAAAIAAMTRATMAEEPVDPERVYVVGVSVGGLMAGVEAAAYSDVFAAAANVESAAYADGFCFGTGTGIPVQTSAQLAFTQLQPRARIVPTMVMTSDGDQAFPYTCGEKALQQGLRMNNLVISGDQETPLALTPASVRHEQVPGGYRYDVGSYRDPGGCLVAEQWLIHGMPHSWPGGPTVDPRYTGYTDPKAPSGADATWAFVSRYRKSETGLPCAEAATAATTPRPTTTTAVCSSHRTVTYRLPPGATLHRVTVAGRRSSVRARRGRVTIDLTGRSAATRVVLIATTRAGHRYIRVSVLHPCRSGAPRPQAGR